MKAIAGILTALAVLVAASSMFHNHILKRAVAEAEAAYIQLKVDAEAARLEHEREIRDLREREAELWGMVDSTNTVIADLEARDVQAARKIAALRLEFTKVDEECRRQLTGLDEAWKERYGLAQMQIVEYQAKDKLKDEIIVNLQLEVVSYSRALDKERAFSASKDKIIRDLGIRLDRQKKQKPLEMLACGSVGFLGGVVFGI